MERLVDRNAEVGERIKITNACWSCGNYKNGDELIVTKRENKSGDILGNVRVENFGTCILDSEYEVIEKEFGLSDLVSGKHVVRLRTDEFGLGIFIGERILFKGNWCGKYQINDDLTSKRYKDNDIMEIFEIKNTQDLLDVLKLENLTSIWTRKVKKRELEIEELKLQLQSLESKLEKLEK